ncbi:hypothetical protein LTR10_005548 [Elasticomyces elasticus]|nr:hypothetical protein LTR10_005548 [Elasticomyces elasticus]KAK4976284.1 hypothetical protein LTR42_003913 [Elasticomyces elasticus]
MRTYLLPTSLLLTLTAALQLPDFQPFLAALALNGATPTPTPTTGPSLHELLKRQATISANSCPTSYINCANLGAASLCCDSNAVCSADFAGNVACCRKGAACSGTIGSIITAGTVSNGMLVGAAGAAGATSGSGGLVTAGATTTTNNGLASSTTAAGGNGLVAASTTTAGTVAGGGGFVLDGTSTVATPGFGVRRAEAPLLARAILKALQYLPI